MGTCTKKFVVGAVEGNGTLTMYLDPTPDAGQELVVVGQNVDFELYPGGETSGQPTRTFNAVITDRGESAEVNGLVELQASYAVNGAITRGAVP